MLVFADAISPGSALVGLTVLFIVPITAGIGILIVIGIAISKVVQGNKAPEQGIATIACPFCNAYTTIDESNIAEGDTYTVTCKNCGKEFQRTKPG